jgi:hypothetical protein
MNLHQGVVSCISHGMMDEVLIIEFTVRGNDLCVRVNMMKRQFLCPGWMLSQTSARTGGSLRHPAEWEQDDNPKYEPNGSHRKTPGQSVQEQPILSFFQIQINKLTKSFVSEALA